jgi:hypothetical protein
MTDQQIDWQGSTSYVDNAILTYCEPPKNVGWWVMPGSSKAYSTKFAAYEKPNALVRFSMKYVFGWTWENKHD